MKKLVLILSILVFALSTMAEGNSSELNHGRHSLRLGWGLGTKQFYADYKNLLFVMPPSAIQGIRKSALPVGEYDQLCDLIQGMSAEEAHKYLMNCSVISYNGPYSFGHLFLGYRYDINSWLSAGAEADWLYLWGSDRYRDGYGAFLADYSYSLHQLTIMPTVRFTYFRCPLVELYAGLGLGYTFYNRGLYDVHGFTFSPTLFGVNLGNEHWFAEVELGGMATVATSWVGRTGLLFSSRILSIAFGYRF